MIDKNKLNNIYREILDEKIIYHIADLEKISLRQAMDIYYKSKLSKQIYDGDYGIENLDYKYLAQDLIENEPELFNENIRITS